MEDMKVGAVAKVKLTKLAQDGSVLEVNEHTVELTEKEAEALWHSQQQD